MITPFIHACLALQKIQTGWFIIVTVQDLGQERLPAHVSVLIHISKKVIK